LPRVSCANATVGNVNSNRTSHTSGRMRSSSA
jgi:hypothetical protein